MSRELSEILDLPVIHLDKYYHDKKYDFENDNKAWKEKVKNLMNNKKEWIVEGIYPSTFEYRLPVADKIIFLDYPRRISVRRILKRRIEYRIKKRDDMPEGWKEKINMKYMKFVLLEYPNERRSVVIDGIKNYNDKLVILCSPHQTTRYVKTLQK